jgi:hypothetical protein
MLILNDSESTKWVSAAKLAGYWSRRVIMYPKSIRGVRSWYRVEWRSL